MKVEVTKDWRKLQNEELHNSYHSTNITLAIKSRMTSWVGLHGRKRTVYRVLLEKPQRLHERVMH
jgi:hypothetical protein